MFATSSGQELHHIAWQKLEVPACRHLLYKRIQEKMIAEDEEGFHTRG